jgi:hypothetical protein
MIHRVMNVNDEMSYMTRYDINKTTDLQTSPLAFGENSSKAVGFDIQKHR